MNKKLPVLILAFNRTDHVEQSMKAVQEYKPDRLYLECDGSRANKNGEADAVEATRKKMLEMVTWPCEVKTLFREENLGCAKAVYGAISWFFECEEYGVIIEDDVVVGQDFFKLCEDLLLRYKDVEKIMEISAQNHYAQPNQSDTYVFTNDFHCWGWATWARAWKKMDMQMKKWPEFTLFRLIKTFDIFRGVMMYYYLHSIYKNLEKSTSWATRWFFSIIANDGLCIQPGVNLAVNIGMKGGAHYKSDDVDPYGYLNIEKMKWPLAYDDNVVLNPFRLYLANKDFKRIRWIGAKKKIKRIFRRLFCVE